MRKLISACSILPPRLTLVKEFARDSKTSAMVRRDLSGSFFPSSGPSMAYLVKISLRAESDLETIYSAINAEFSDAAFRWFNGLELALFTLEESPARCPITPEDRQLRNLLYGKKPH